MGDGDEMMDDLMSARRPVDDALDRLERGYPLTDADLATVRSELERLREERDSARSANRELAAERDEALAALRLFVHYDKPRVGIIGRFAVVDVRVNEADYHKARALLSASPSDGGGASRLVSVNHADAASDIVGRSAICPDCGSALLVDDGGGTT